jgi:hypothetical protein
MEPDTKASSVQRLRETEVSLGLILKVPLGRVEDIEAQLENAFGLKLIFAKFSAGKLWIVDKHPKEAP